MTTDREREPDGLSPIGARKATILRAVVAEHIATAQPVGSGLLSAATGLGVSSATIRHELSALERDGFLTHPHTSAGRVPTDKGYRFYVDSLQAPGRLSGSKSQQVRQFFEGAHGELEQLLAETSRLLSNLTAYAAVVVGPRGEGSPVRSVQIVGLGAATAIVVAVLANGAVEKAAIEVGADVSDSQLGAANAHLAALATGELIASLASPRAEMRSSGDARVDSIVHAAIGALVPRGEGDGPGVFVGGASRMASAFETVETIRRVLAAMEEQYVVVSLLREALERSADADGASVSIGTEHGADQTFESLLTCSVVVAPYLVDGRSAGTIGVLGPTRMDYPEAMAAVASVSESLSQRLADG